MEPIVFLAFANSRENSLNALKEEDERIYPLLLKDSLENGYSIVRDPYATPQTINEIWAQIGRQIAVFHYSGHASGTSLLLDDQVINANGIANLLAESASTGVLKCVILNGCSTGNQVRQLLELGVPAVIATHAPINDKSAGEFAVRFFKNLAEGNMTIEGAFYNALVYAQNTTKQDLGIKNKANRGMQYLTDADPAESLWELFCADRSAVTINPLPKIGIIQTDSTAVNTMLRLALIDALAANGNIEIGAIRSSLDKHDYIDPMDIHDKLVRVLPMPIGEHLRKLFCPSENDELNSCDKISFKRLEQICRVYSAVMEFLTSIVICELWEVYNPNGFETALVDQLNDHFGLSAAERAKFDFKQFLIHLFEYLIKPGRVCFVSELVDVRDEMVSDGEFAEACDYLRGLNTRCLDKTQPVRPIEVQGLCIDAEQWLACLFKKLGFLHSYHLTSVQAISILKHRFSTSPSYTHSVVKLMRVGGSEKFLYELTDCLACQGVGLLKGPLKLFDQQKKIFKPDGNLNFLNLSPFLFDAYAFESVGKSRIVIFDEFTSGGSYRFKDVCKPDSTRDIVEVNENNAYQSVKMEMDHYRSKVLGGTIN